MEPSLKKYGAQMLKVKVSLALLIFFSGCYSLSENDKKQLVIKRAIFDLSCSKENVRVVKLLENTYGASGCGRRVSYITDSCEGMSTKSQILINCKIIMNSDSKDMDKK